jgi:hypothetical protein
MHLIKEETDNFAILEILIAISQPSIGQMENFN